MRIAFAILVSTCCCFGQPWSGILNGTRAINWSNAGVVGGIPDATWTQCGATISAGASAATIQGAVNHTGSGYTSCGSNTYVLLGAGTFSLSSGIVISTSNTELRGSGPKSTILKFSAGSSCDVGNSAICIEGNGNDENSPAATCTWSGGYTQGTTSITLSSCSAAPTTSDLLILDQANQTAVQTGYFACDVEGTCSTEGSNGFGRTISGVDWQQQQIVSITAVSGSGPYTVTISPGIYANNWNTVNGKTPGAWWTGGIVNDVGVANMTLDYTGASGGCSSGTVSGVTFFNAYDSWMNNIRSIGNNSFRNHVWFRLSAHNTVENSYFYGNGNSSCMYQIESQETSDNLVINNILQHSPTQLMSGPHAGDVYAYNYMVDNYANPADFLNGDVNSAHSAGAYMNLYEGNYAVQGIGDDIHGSNGLTTFFRNQLLGVSTGLTNNTSAINFNSYSRYHSLVANVLGVAGSFSNFLDDESAPTGNPNASILLTGFSGEGESTTGGLPNDSAVLKTMLLWGNYDTVHNSAQYNCTYVPSDLTCSGLSETFPASFFLSSKPSFWATNWGTPPWPTIGPDVTGGSDSTGHAYAIPAGMCYANSSQDSSYQTTYSVTGATYSGGTVTLTIGSNSGFIIGDLFTVSGITPSGYNGTYQVTALSGSTKIEYAPSSDPATYSSGGSISYPNILAYDANACYGTSTVSSTPPPPPVGLTATAH
jgi:hypothetical protein